MNYLKKTISFLKIPANLPNPNIDVYLKAIITSKVPPTLLKSKSSKNN